MLREPAARTCAGALPVVPVRARGLTIEGADGRRYLDCFSGAGTLPLGHNHPAVLEAIRKVLDSGAPLHAPDMVTPVEDAFVTELLRTLPRGLAAGARVLFCGPGDTDPLRAAAELIRRATGRAGAEVAVHPGDGGGGLAGAGRSSALNIFDFSGDLSASDDAGAGRCSGSDTGIGGVGPAGAAREAGLAGGVGTADLLGPAREFGAAERSGAGAGTGAVAGAGAGRGGGAVDGSGGAGGRSAALAGIVVAPVGPGGEAVPLPDERLWRLRGITSELGVPLVVDETHTGVGRTGAFWAVQHSGVVPDVLVLPKAIGGSLPLAVLVCRDDLLGRGVRSTDTGETVLGAVAPDSPGPHAAGVAGFRGNQLAMAAGTATLAHVRENGLAERAARLGARMLARLRELEHRFACVDRVHGYGLLLSVRMAGTALASAVRRECLNRGLIVDLGGRHGDVVRLLPPLTISDEQTEAVLDRLAEAIEAVDPLPPGPPPHELSPASPQGH